MPESLPSLIGMSDFGNDWDAYLEELYRIYLAEIVNGKLLFNGLPIRVQFRPMSHGKGFGFWHLISEGKTEEDRVPDPRRCERVHWISWVIRNIEINKNIKWWKNKRGADIRVVLWHRDEKFVVVLAERKEYYLLRSAYPVNSRRERTFQREWQEFWKKKG
jgi:hypothetical protein